MTDDETVSTEVTLTVDPATLDEGDGATTVTVTGTLNGGTRDAATAVTVSVGASDAVRWKAPTTTVEDAHDRRRADGGDADLHAGRTMSTANDATDDATGFTVTATTVTIADDDERGVSVTALVVLEGGSGTGDGDGDGYSEVTVSGALTFTASDWTAQTVTVARTTRTRERHGDGGARWRAATGP